MERGNNREQIKTENFNEITENVNKVTLFSCIFFEIVFFTSLLWL